VSRLGVLLLVVVAAALTAAVALAAQSPRAVRTSILDAAKAQQSVHYVARQIAGNSLLTLTGDVAAADGRQQVSFKAGKETGHMTILVLDQTAYVEGDSNGLQQLLGLSKAQASTYAGQWISIPKADKHYSSAAASVTLGSFLQSITPSGRLAILKTKVGGRRVIGVRAISGTGKKKKLQILDAPTSGKRLPLEEEDLWPARQYLSITKMSKWNESVQVQAPANAVPITTVVGH
jgi:hypothetical protein